MTRRSTTAPRWRRGSVAAFAGAALLLGACSGGAQETAGEAEPGAPSGTATPTTTSAPPTDAATTTAPPDAATTTPPAPSPTPTSTPSPTGTTEPEPEAALDSFGVSSGDPLATDAGLAVLERGGTAADAAVATALVDAVMQPGSSGIGGGGAALVVDAGGTAVNYDFRDAAGLDGATAGRTGVPGLVAGLALLHEEYGTLPWEDLVQPAIDAAADGAPLSAFTAQILDTGLGRAATEGLGHFRGPDGAVLAAGEPLVQTELADTLRVLAQEGPDSLYTGTIAEDLVREGGLRPEDLAAYEVRVSEPVSGPVGEYEVLSAAPGLSGVPLIQTLQILEAAGAGDLGPVSVDLIDTQIGAWALAEEDRERTLGDPAAVRVPTELLDPERNADLAADLPGAAPAAAGGAEPVSTTHVSVVDADGLAISMTNTISENWGTGEYVSGFFLNNHLDLFERIAGEANRPGPGRRPTSRMAPTVVVDAESRPVLVIGAPGGEQIPQALATVITRWALQGQSLEDAVAAPRVRVTGGSAVTVEEPDWVGPLRARGRTVEAAPARDAHLFSSVQALEIDWADRQVSGATDTRRSADTRTGNPD